MRLTDFFHINKNKIGNITFLVLIFCILLISNTLFSQGTQYNIKDFGAVGDGKTLDTKAINKTIEHVHKNGGGSVIFPKGEYLSFSVRLESNIEIIIDKDAKIIAADPGNHNGPGYDIPDYNIWGDSLRYQDFGHSHWKNSLFWGINLENIVIRGHGIIYGKGLTKKDFRKPGLGNKVFAFKNCRNILIKDISVLQGGHFCILATGVDSMRIEGMKIDSNRDGINIDCCTNVDIIDCKVNTPNDDAIVLKSSFALGYFKNTENVKISGCTVSGYDMGTFLDGTFGTTQIEAPDKGGVTGRIKLGTESNGGFINITVNNCSFEHCRGIAIETVDGALIKDITFSNISMHDIVNAPFYIRVGSRLRGPEGTPVGTTQNIRISNITVTGVPPRYGAMIMGIQDHPAKDVYFKNISIEVEGGAPKSQSDIIVPELEDGYPDPRLYGEIPAYGFYIRHASELILEDIDITYLKKDERPVFIMEDVSNSTFRNIETGVIDSNKTILLKDVQNLRFKNVGNVKKKKIKKVDSLEL